MRRQKIQACSSPYLQATRPPQHSLMQRAHPSTEQQRVERTIGACRACSVQERQRPARRHHPLATALAASHSWLPAPANQPLLAGRHWPAPHAARSTRPTGSTAADDSAAQQQPPVSPPWCAPARSAPRCCCPSPSCPPRHRPRRGGGAARGPPASARSAVSRPMQPPPVNRPWCGRTAACPA